MEVPAENLAPNPGFETFEESWVLPQSEQTSVVLEAEDVQEGETAVRIEYRGETAWAATPADAVHVEPGENLVASGYAKTVELTGELSLRIDELNADEVLLLSHSTTPLSGSHDWTQMRLSLTTSAETQLVRIYVRVVPVEAGSFSGTVLLDSLSLRPPAPRELTVNGSIDDGLSEWHWHTDVPTYVHEDRFIYRSPPASIRLDPKEPGAADVRETWNAMFSIVSAGQVVTASVYSRTDPGFYETVFSGSLVNMDFRLIGRGGIHGGGGAMLLPWGTDEWTRTEVTDIAGPDEHRVILALGAFPFDHEGSAWFDDASLTITDLMPNPGFEYFRPTGWGFRGQRNEQWAHRVDAETRHCGQASLRVDFFGVPEIYDYLMECNAHTYNAYYPLTDLAIPVTPGSTVLLRGYVRTENLSTPTRLELAEYDVDGTLLGRPRREPHNPTEGVMGTNDWVRLERLVELQPETHYVFVRIRTAIADTVGGAGPQPITGTAWYDDIWLVPQP